MGLDRLNSGIGQTEISILPVPSTCCVTSSNWDSLSELQLPPLPKGPENPYLLRNGVRQGDNTVTIVTGAEALFRSRGPAGPSCVGEFQGGTPTSQTRRTSILGGSGTQGGESPLAQACLDSGC